MANTVLQLDDVRKEFGDLLAVKDVSIQLERGEFFSLLGPSGCGKTTTLRMIAGLEDLTEGDIVLAGQHVNRQPPNKREVNTVFQDLVLFPHMTVSENIEYGLKRSGVPEKERAEQVQEMLSVIDLPDVGDRRPQELSGGQQQRVSLARSLVNEPKVLLLDEPLSSLDQRLKEEMQLELQRIQRQVDTTFLYVTHDQNSAMSMSDRIGVMNHGELVEVGPPEELYHSPKTEFVSNFLGDANVLRGNIKNLNGEKAWVEIADSFQITTRKNGYEPSVDEKVTVVVRPEDIEPNPELGQQVTVTARSYKGFYTEYTLDLEPAGALKARFTKTNNEYEVNDTFCVSFTNSAIVDEA